MGTCWSPFWCLLFVFLLRFITVFVTVETLPEINITLQMHELTVLQCIVADFVRTAFHNNASDMFPCCWQSHGNGATKLHNPQMIGCSCDTCSKLHYQGIWQAVYNPEHILCVLSSVHLMHTCESIDHLIFSLLSTTCLLLIHITNVLSPRSTAANDRAQN